MSSPRTIIELADYEGFGPERGPAPHKAARVYINGQEVRVAKDGIEVTTSDATRVTLELLPDEVRFVREPQGPSEEQVEAFKEEWHQADFEGDTGNRVRRGLAAALGQARPGRITADRIEADSIKLSGEPEPEFEIGDRVYSHDHVKMGKVTERWDRHWYRVDFDDGHGAFIHQDRLAKASKPEPKPVVQAGWTLAERERRRQKRRVKKIMISSQPYMLNFDAREINPNLYRTLFGE